MFRYKFLSLDEPTTISGGGYNYRHPNIIKQVEEIIDDGVSVIALDEDDHLIGIMLSHTGYWTISLIKIYLIFYKKR